MTRRFPFVVVLLLASLFAAPLFAQAPDASLRVAVTDATGAVIVGARVVVVQAGRAEREATTGSRGEATLTDLAVGTADIRVEAPGFDPRAIAGQRVRGGANKLDVRLQIAKFAVNVEVSRDPREKQTDPRGDAFTRVLGVEQIAMLPDDPDEMERVINQMAGPGALIRVNGFGGGRLPAKGTIRQIRFSLNTFSAEMHDLGMPIVDIQTQPGLDTWHTTLSAGFRNPALTTRYAYSQAPSSDQVRRGGLVTDGPLWRNHTSLSFNIDQSSLSDAQTYLAKTPSGRVSGMVTRPSDRTNFSIFIEHALTKAHTTRFELTRGSTAIENAGVSGANVPERGYITDQRGYTLRLSDNGPIGKRFFNEVRFQSAWNDQSSRSLTALPAVLVLDAFSMGGAGNDSTRHAWEIEAADNLDFARGRHAVRTGVLLQAGSYRSVDQTNQYGTFTFSGLDAFMAGTPTTYVRRVGDPLVQYGFAKVGLYVQDDVKVHKSLTVSAGLREEAQSRISGKFNPSPRAGFTWAPRPNGKLTVRGGAGFVYTWFEPSAYEQTLRVDGQRQYDIVIAGPGYPDPLVGGIQMVLPPSRLTMAPDLQLPRVLSSSISVQQQFRLMTMLMTTYTHQRGTGLFRGRNLNAPLPDFTRPFPDAGNITQVESTGRSSLDRLDIVFTHGVMRNAKLLFLFLANYSLAQQKNDTDGPFSLPADSHNPAADWGPSAGDVRHRGSTMITATLPKGLRVMGLAMFTSAPPYTITTGFDNNHDTVSNDRPAGVGRNTARGAGMFDTIVRLGWTVGFGKPPAPPTGIPNMRRLRSESDPLGAVNSLSAQAHRYRIEFYGQVYNLLNHVNRIGYRGVLTSPFFGTATAAMPPRRIEIGTRFDF